MGKHFNSTVIYSLISGKCKIFSILPEAYTYININECEL